MIIFVENTDMSANRDKLNKLNSGSYKFTNQYIQDFVNKSDIDKPSDPNAAIKKLAEKGRPVTKPVEPKQKGIIEYEGGIWGRLGIMQQEIDSLKFDIVSLLQIIQEDYPDMTINAIREYYSNFRAGSGHILNRVANKIESINKNDLKF